MGGRIAAFVFCILLLFCQGTLAAGKHNVLLLNSYHTGYRWTDTLTSAIKATLFKRPDVVLYVEYMDMKRWPDGRHFDHVEGMLEHKFSAKEPGTVRLDAVICADDDALDFALAHRDRLFPDIPLVFCGINDFHPSRIASVRAITGVTEDYDFVGTLDVILTIHPDTKKFLAVGDSTKSGKEAMRRMDRAAEHFRGRAEFERLVDPGVTDLEARLRALGPGTIVLYVAYQHTAAGTLFSLEESRKIVSVASPVPVYCFWDFFPGTGVVGGRELSAATQGRAAAGLVSRILDGEDVNKMALVEVPTPRFGFDFDALRRFGIDDATLPEQRWIANRPKTFYSDHWPWLWGVSAFILLEIALVVSVALGLRNRRALAAQLRQAQKMEAVGRLAGGIAHDFRNQLTVIDGHCELLEKHLAPEGTHLRHLSLIRDAVGRAASMTNQLLAFSRKQVLRPRSMYLNTVLEGMHETLRRLIGERIRLEIRCDTKLRKTYVDPHQLEQAVLNLVTNARDAMPDGGSLIMETSNETVARTSQRERAMPSGNYVVLTVSDTGRGMERDVKDHIFEPFFTTKDVGQGTGLGLAIVHGFVQQSGGYIRVESAPGEGTRVALYFPATSTIDHARAELVSPPITVTTSPGRGETILVAEDETAVLELMTEALDQAGYRVLPAKTPAEALEKASAADRPIDMLVTDVLMPAMRGPDLAAKLKERRGDLPVLFISGFVRDTFSTQEMVTVQDNFLLKPFATSVLLRKVRKMLDARGKPPASPAHGTAAAPGPAPSLPLET